MWCNVMDGIGFLMDDDEYCYQLVLFVSFFLRYLSHSKRDESTVSLSL